MAILGLSKRLFTILLGMAGIFAAVTATAQSDRVASHRARIPQATLQAEASITVPQDTVRITLATEVSDASQAAVAEALSKTVDSALSQAKKGTDKIKVSSGDYRVWPMSDQDGKISNWRGRAEIVLESSDFAATSALAGQLADRMPVSNLNFFVAPEARAKHEEALLGQAAQAFRERAKALTEAFGFSGYTIKEIDLSGTGARYEAAPRMMAMADAKSRVPLEAGTEIVTVSVRGSIFLRSEQK